ncbi:MAG: hypothetical protein Q7R52_03870 [archaeon]|nr:hypothetical protein [archaeon]
MRKILSLFILAAVLLTTVVSATVYEPNYVYNENTNQALTDVSVIGFICDNADCTQNRAFWPGTLNTGNNNIIVLQYPTYLLSDYGYQIYFYKEGYFPYKVNADWFGEGRTPNQNVYLSKMDGASVNIENFQLSKTEIKTNEQIEITANILSPRINEDNVQFIPEQLKNDYYSDDVKVTLYVNGQVEDTKNLNMLWSSEQNVEFSYTPTEAGTYSIQLQTEITDNKFFNSHISTEGNQLIVSEEAIPESDTTKPTITITSPESKEYHVSEIKFRINTDEGLSDAWFILNLGSAVTMTRISATAYEYTMNLNDRNYEVTFYAEDIAGNIGTKTVKFSVDTTNPDTTESSNNNGYRIIQSDDETTINQKTTSNNVIFPEESTIKIQKTTDSNEWSIYLWIFSILSIILLIIIIAIVFRRV